MFFVPLEAAEAAEATFPAWGVGLFTLVLLLLALTVVRGVGKGRPHS